MQEPTGPIEAAKTSPTQAEIDRHRLFNLSLDLLCIAGLDGYFRQVNPSWTRVLGWSVDELLSRPIAEFMHPEDRERSLQARAALARGNQVRGLENRYICKDGGYRWLSWQASIEPGADTVFAVARDITEHRKLEHDLLILGKQESTGLLAGGIAHDFNNLLTNLQLNLEMLGFTGTLTGQQRQHLAQARETVHAARSLTQQLLSFTQDDVSSRHVIKLGDLLRQSLDLALAGSNVRGELVIAPDLLPAEVDEVQLAQVIRNLVLNARESMPRGGKVRLCAENVVLDGRQGPDFPVGDYIRISVTDEGDGIATEIMPRIFDPYFSTKQRGSQKGMGLGLTICHAVLQRHGGLISVESHVGIGTTVLCHLPAAERPAPPISPPASGRSAGSRRILVMDDEPGVREIIAMALNQLGYAAELAETGAEAVALHEAALDRGEPFAAVLLDLTMRGGPGGTEVIKKLLQRDPSLRAVLMTGYNHQQTFHDHILHGFGAALAKPFSVDGLGEKLREVLGPGLPVHAASRHLEDGDAAAQSRPLTCHA